MAITVAELCVRMEELFMIIDVNRSRKLQPPEEHALAVCLHNQFNPGEPLDA